MMLCQRDIKNSLNKTASDIFNGRYNDRIGLTIILKQDYARRVPRF